MRKLLRTMLLVAAIAYAMSLALPTGAGAATGQLTVAPKSVASGGVLTVKAVATTPTGCQLALNAPSGRESSAAFRPEQRQLSWKIRVAKTAVSGHWTISVLCDGVGPVSSTSFTVAGHGTSTRLGTIPAPAERGARLTGANSATRVAATVAAPVITWSGAAQNGTTRAAQVQFDFSRGDNFECAIDVQAFQACQSPFVTGQLAKGAHTFRVRAVDGAARSQAVVWHWTTDTNFYPFAGGYDTCEAYAYRMRPDIFDSSNEQQSGTWFPATWVAHARAANYVVDHVPQVGDVAIWPAGYQGSDPTGGHAAYVERVNADGSAYVSEMGVIGVSGVFHETLAPSVVANLWFIHTHP